MLPRVEAVTLGSAQNIMNTGSQNSWEVGGETGGLRKHGFMMIGRRKWDEEEYIVKKPFYCFAECMYCTDFRATTEQM